MAKKPTTPPPAPAQEPIRIVIPPSINERMAAITSLAGAIHECAKALNVPPVQIQVTGCHFNVSGDAPGITFSKPE